MFRIAVYSERLYGRFQLCNNKSWGIGKGKIEMLWCNSGKFQCNVNEGGTSKISSNKFNIIEE